MYHIYPYFLISFKYQNSICHQIIFLNAQKVIIYFLNYLMNIQFKIFMYEKAVPIKNFEIEFDLDLNGMMKQIS